VDRGDQRSGEAQGEQRRIELLDALVELLLDVGDLLAQRFQVAEDRAELRFSKVFCLACADRLLGRFEQLVDGLGSDPSTARAGGPDSSAIGVPSGTRGRILGPKANGVRRRWLRLGWGRPRAADRPASRPPWPTRLPASRACTT
jgi:hypothetical protein